MKKQLFKTGDGSFTLYLPEMNETYHSKFGAVNEAKHVFIKSGLQYINKDSVKILEVGFGTGLNAFLSLVFFLKTKKIKNIYYHSLEKFPLPGDITEKLNYFTSKKEKKLFEILHQSPWNQEVEIVPGFVLYKQKTDLQDFKFPLLFDLVYFDAFAPNKQAELWTPQIFSNLYGHMNKKGIFVTYSAKGQVRRDLASAGFDVERIEGPPGKREMLRAVKIN